MARYLVMADLATAQARSTLRAVTLGCQGVTDYWWPAFAHPNSGAAALEIADAGDYGPAGLTDFEAAALQSHEALAAAGWFPVPQ